jgi:hypothetical protein
MTLAQRLAAIEERLARAGADAPDTFVLPDDATARDLARRFEARVAALPTAGLSRRDVERLVFADREACLLANDFERRLAQLTPPATPAGEPQ